MKYIIPLFLCLICLPIFAQQEIAIGDWKSHLAFRTYSDITQSDNNIYVAAVHGIAKISKDDLLVEKITKVEGLTDSDPRKVLFDKSTTTLVIGYENGNIDLMTADGVINVPNILNNTNVGSEKEPLNLRADDKGNVYMAYNFGLVQYNLSLQTFGFSLITGFPISDIAIHDDRYYIATEEGIYYAPIANTVNHADLGSWSKLTEGWPEPYTSRAIASNGNQLIADLNGDLVEIRNDVPTTVQVAPEDYAIRQISVLPDRMAVSYEYTLNGPSVFRQDNLFFFDENLSQTEAYTSASCVIVVNRVIQDEEGRIFYANERDIKLIESIGAGCESITVTRPARNDAYEITFAGNEVIVATGNVQDNGSPTRLTTGLFLYKDGVWDQFNHEDGFFGDSLASYLDVAVGPMNEIAVGTHYRGLFILSPDREMVTLYNDRNSCIGPQTFDIASIWDLTYDEDGNLWVSNFRTTVPLKVIDTEGNCRDVEISRNFGTNELSEMTIDNRGRKWIATHDASTAVIVFDEGDLDNPGDDQFRVLKTTNTALESNRVWDIVNDLDGDVWVGTDKGAVVFDCAAGILDNGCFGRKPIVEVEGVAALLLENESVRAIAVDGANRKWFGTTNGIFVQSPNGEEEILQFNEKNSPLISNFIRDISINQLTGEVFIATDKGIMSYRTDATQGDKSFHANESEVFAFPNPVRPEYVGPIAIKGLPRNANVKITDVQGKLVFEGVANGGQAIWDGTDYNGNKAASGVYLVFSSTPTSFEKPDALVSKILIVR